MNNIFKKNIKVNYRFLDFVSKIFYWKSFEYSFAAKI